jgi:hypothetical protein
MVCYRSKELRAIDSKCCMIHRWCLRKLCRVQALARIVGKFKFRIFLVIGFCLLSNPEATEV